MVQNAMNIRKELDEQLQTADLNTNNILIEQPSTNPDMHPVNGNYTLPDEEEDEDDDTEDDLILGDEAELTGDEEEFDVELEEDVDAEDLDEDDLVIDNEDEEDEDEL